MIYVTHVNSEYQIKTAYDPTVIDLIKNVPGRVWHPGTKVWTIPDTRLGFLINQFKGTSYESQLVIDSDENINVNESVDTTNVIPDIDISDIKQYVENGYHLFQHQVDFLKYAKYRDTQHLMSGFILADEPGAGKTLEMTNLALYHRQKYKHKHCLIICCVNTAKYNWVDDIIKHTNGEEHPYILGSRIKRNGEINYLTGNAERLEDLKTGRMYGDKKGNKLPYFLVINIEALRYRLPKSKVYPIAKALIDMVNSCDLNMIGIDEIHKNCSPSSKQGQQLLNIKKHTGSKVYWMPITGTPIVNKPTDVFTPLKLVDGHTYSSFYMWCQKYCIYGGFGGHEIIGYKNIPELKDMLQRNMLRRLKADFIDLPDKLYYTEYVENTLYQRHLYNMVLADLRADIHTIQTTLNPVVKFLRLRQVNGAPEIVDTELTIDSQYKERNAKFLRLLELVDEIVDRNEKVIIYSNWVEPLRTIYKLIHPKYKLAAYTGTMSEDSRQQQKARFIEDPATHILIGTIGALGTSHTLTVANNIIFYDEPWTPTDKEQAIDRVHRPGAVKTIHVYTLLTKDTVDEKVHDILYTKSSVSKYIVDNKLDFKNNPDLVQMLLQ